MKQPPRFVSEMKDLVDEDAHVQHSEVRILESSRDRCSGDLEIHPFGEETVIVSWASVAPAVRVMFHEYVLEGVDSQMAVAVVTALLEGRFIKEDGRGLLRSRRIVVQSESGPVVSDWTR